MKIVNSNTGLTLVEILFAALIITVAAVAIIQSYLSNIYLSEVNKEETIAQMQLTNMMEAIKCTMPFSDIIVNFPNGVAGGTTGNNYANLVGGYVLKNEQIKVSYVNPSSDPLEITASVSWQDRRGINRTKYLVTKRTR